MVTPDFSPIWKIGAAVAIVGLGLGGIIGQGITGCQQQRASKHAEATISQQAAHVAADLKARCEADQRAAFLAGRQYEAHYSDSLRHALAPAHSRPALPEHPPRQ